MKNKFIQLILLFASMYFFGQIGINTSNPQGTLHVDGAKDNNASGAPTAAQQANDFIVTSSGNVGIGTVTPNASAVLDVSSSNKGFLLPRISLQSITDAVTITALANGLIVYNTNASIINGFGTGLYFNSGTPATPNWASYSNLASGAATAKIVYSGATGILANSVKLGGFEFAIDSNNIPQFRLISAPSSNVIVDWNLLEAFSPSNQDFYTRNTTFTTANYNTYQYFTSHSADGLTSSGEVNIMYMTIRNAANPVAYKVTFFEQGAASPYTWVIWVEKI